MIRRTSQSHHPRNATTTWVRTTQPGWPPQARAKTNAVGKGSIWGWPHAIPSGNRLASSDGRPMGITRYLKFLENGNFCMKDTPMTTTMPTLTKSRIRLSQVLQEAGDLVSVNDVCRTLQVERPEAAKVLARWQARAC